eukprot:m.7259 g.7259  ORF g.7259 m.7259 type:complete len:194 (+) comp9041_c0_seq1:146-727(+)
MSGNTISETHRHAIARAVADLPTIQGLYVYRGIQNELNDFRQLGLALPAVGTFTKPATRESSIEPAVQATTPDVLLDTNEPVISFPRTLDLQGSSLLYESAHLGTSFAWSVDDAPLPAGEPISTEPTGGEAAIAGLSSIESALKNEESEVMARAARTDPKLLDEHEGQPRAPVYFLPTINLWDDLDAILDSTV